MRYGKCGKQCGKCGNLPDKKAETSFPNGNLYAKRVNFISKNGNLHAKSGK